MTDSSRMANQRSSDCECLMSTSLLLAHWNDMWFLDFLGFDMKCFVTCGEHNMSVKNRWLFMPCESQFTMQINRFITALQFVYHLVHGT
jgi:hypothetical protein